MVPLPPRSTFLLVVFTWFYSNFAHSSEALIFEEGLKQTQFSGRVLYGTNPDKFLLCQAYILLEGCFFRSSILYSYTYTHSVVLKDCIRVE